MYNVQNHYWTVANSTTQVWSSKANDFVNISDKTYQAWLAEGNSPTKVQSVSVALGSVILQTDLLGSSDTTMHRISEAVSLGLNSWENADVIAWIDWRRGLRAIVSGNDTTSKSIPIQPDYPEGT